MASSLSPVILTYKVDGAIAKGKAVKIGSDGEHVVVAAAASDKLIGVAQVAATTAEDAIEVALGGGGKGLAQTTVTAGERLTSHTDGKLKAASSGEYIVGIALKDAVVGDLFDMLVIPSIY